MPRRIGPMSVAAPRLRASRAQALALAATLVLVAGCRSLLPSGEVVRYPTDAAVTAAGVTIGCRAVDPLCIVDARGQLLELAGNLETPHTGPGVMDPQEPDVVGTLTVTYSGPEFRWTASDGSTGTATTIAVDLAPLLRQGSAYAVLATSAGTIRYSPPVGQANQLLTTLFVQPDPFVQ